MDTPEIIRLFVVDDHPVVRAGLRSVEEMSPHIRIVGEAGDADEALAQMKKLKPDVALLDVRLQGMNGIELCRQLKTALPATRVLILTSYVDDQLILTALEAGADGYLLKESDTNRLVNAISEVHRGEVVFDPEVTRQLASQKADVNAGGLAQAMASLTVQERRLLSEVAKGRTDKEAAVQLGITTKTARNYLDRIFTKLGVHNRTEAAMLYARSQNPASHSRSNRAS